MPTLMRNGLMILGSRGNPITGNTAKVATMRDHAVTLARAFASKL